MLSKGSYQNERVITFGEKKNNNKIIASSPITSRKIEGEKMDVVTDFLFWAPISLQMVTAVMKLKGACSLEENL